MIKYIYLILYIICLKASLIYSNNNNNNINNEFIEINDKYIRHAVTVGKRDALYLPNMEDRPVAILPDPPRQFQGIGTELPRAGLGKIRRPLHGPPPWAHVDQIIHQLAKNVPDLRYYDPARAGINQKYPLKPLVRTNNPSVVGYQTKEGLSGKVTINSPPLPESSIGRDKDELTNGLNWNPEDFNALLELKWKQPKSLDPNSAGAPILSQKQSQHKKIRFSQAKPKGKMASKTTPTVFLLPDLGQHALLDPTHSVEPTSRQPYSDFIANIPVDYGVFLQTNSKSKGIWHDGVQGLGTMILREPISPDNPFIPYRPDELGGVYDNAKVSTGAERPNFPVVSRVDLDGIVKPNMMMTMENKGADRLHHYIHTDKSLAKQKAAPKQKAKFKTIRRVVSMPPWMKNAAKNRGKVSVKFGKGKQSGGKLFGGDNKKEADSLFGGENKKESDSLFGGENKKESDSLFGGENKKESDSLFGGENKKEADSLFGGEDKKESDSLFGGENKKESDSLFGGENKKEADSLFGGDNKKESDSLFGGESKEEENFRELRRHPSLPDEPR